MNCKCDLSEFCGRQDKPCTFEYVNKHKGAYIIGSILTFVSLIFLVQGVVLMLFGIADIELLIRGMMCITVFAVTACILELKYFKPISDYHSCTIHAAAQKCDEHVRRVDELSERLKNF